MFIGFKYNLVLAVVCMCAAVTFVYYLVHRLRSGDEILFIYLGFYTLCIIHCMKSAGHHRNSYDYITYDRTDLYKGGKHVITENWGKFFLVAVQKDKNGNEKVLGTISYRQRKNGEVKVGINLAFGLPHSEGITFVPKLYPG